MPEISLHHGDNRKTLRRMIDRGVRVHSVVTDPPYGLVSIQKRFGKINSKAARTEGNDGSFARLSGGFMGKLWDGTGIERDPEFWALIYEILLPGGYVFAFSGSRTGHWQACAMEMAGFIMHPMHGWAFGSGFPKAHSASAAGEEWEGWAYSTQAQKPALEPIYLGQKPFSEKTGIANLLKHGVGAVNIDGCRVPTNPEVDDPRLGGAGSWKTDKAAQNVYEGGYAGQQIASSSLGRHPANLILDGSPEVVAMFPAKAGAAAPVKGTEPSGVTKDIYGKFAERVPGSFFSDSGSAARFFHQFPRYACEVCRDEGWVVEGENAEAFQAPCFYCSDSMRPEHLADPLFYNGKAGKADRAGSNHPTVKPIALMQYLIRHITPPGGTVLDPFAGSGTTAQAAINEGMNCILMEAEPEYSAFIAQRFGLGTGLERLRSASPFL